MWKERRVKIFRYGRNQVIRIPRDLELPGTDAIIRMERGRLIIEPTQRQSLLALIQAWEPITDDMPTIEDPPPERVDLG